MTFHQSNSIHASSPGLINCSAQRASITIFDSFQKLESIENIGKELLLLRNYYSYSDQHFIYYQVMLGVTFGLWHLGHWPLSDLHSKIFFMDKSSGKLLD